MYRLGPTCAGHLMGLLSAESTYLLGSWGNATIIVKQTQRITIGLEIPLRHWWLSDLNKRIDQALYLLPFLSSQRITCMGLSPGLRQATKYCTAWQKSKTATHVFQTPQGIPRHLDLTLFVFHYFWAGQAMCKVDSLDHSYWNNWAPNSTRFTMFY